jgi:anti-sigma B factor antagonist
MTQGDSRVQIDVDYDDGCSVITVAGELDVYNYTYLREVLEGQYSIGRHRLAVLAPELGFMDSTALGALIRGSRRAVDAGGALVVIGLQERVIKIFRITGLTQVIPVFPDTAAARTYLNAQ